VRRPYPSGDELVNAIKSVGVVPGFQQAEFIHWYPAGASVAAGLDNSRHLRALEIGMYTWSPQTDAISATGPASAPPPLTLRIYSPESMQADDQRYAQIGREAAEYVCWVSGGRRRFSSDLIAWSLATIRFLAVSRHTMNAPSFRRFPQ